MQLLIRSCIAILIMAGLYYSPTIDNKIAILPFNPDSWKFYGEVHLWTWFIYHLVPVLTALFIAIPILTLVLSFKFELLTKYRKAIAVILLSLTLGPGLVVNTVFKNHWGRARPYQVLRDHHTFTPVWQPNFKAKSDNSFCSGHAAIGFFCGVPFWVFNRKRIAVIASLLGGGIIGAVRILQGGHYLSDVIFAGIFVWMCTYITIYIVNWCINIAKTHK